jgi:hypothetical protein
MSDIAASRNIRFLTRIRNQYGPKHQARPRVKDHKPDVISNKADVYQGSSYLQPPNNKNPLLGSDFRSKADSAFSSIPKPLGFIIGLQKQVMLKCELTEMAGDIGFHGNSWLRKAADICNIGCHQ